MTQNICFGRITKLQEFNYLIATPSSGEACFLISNPNSEIDPLGTTHLRASRLDAPAASLLQNPAFTNKPKFLASLKSSSTGITDALANSFSHRGIPYKKFALSQKPLVKKLVSDLEKGVYNPFCWDLVTTFAAKGLLMPELVYLTSNGMIIGYLPTTVNGHTLNGQVLIKDGGYVYESSGTTKVYTSLSAAKREEKYGKIYHLLIHPTFVTASSRFDVLCASRFEVIGVAKNVLAEQHTKEVIMSATKDLSSDIIKTDYLHDNSEYYTFWRHNNDN